MRTIVVLLVVTAFGCGGLRSLARTKAPEPEPTTINYVDSLGVYRKVTLYPNRPAVVINLGTTYTGNQKVVTQKEMREKAKRAGLIPPP